MPRQPNLDAVKALVQQLGQLIGRELAAGISSSLDGAKPGRSNASASSGAGCSVPGCPRKRAAKGLCMAHYGKARKLKMNLEKLTPAQLKELAADGRATRWSKPDATKAAGCSIPGCKRPHAAKRLCVNHYMKAKRLKMKVDALTAADRKKLATDLRGARS